MDPTHCKNRLKQIILWHLWGRLLLFNNHCLTSNEPTMKLDIFYSDCCYGLPPVMSFWCLPVSAAGIPNSLAKKITNKVKLIVPQAFYLMTKQTPGFCLSATLPALQQWRILILERAITPPWLANTHSTCACWIELAALASCFASCRGGPKLSFLLCVTTMIECSSNSHLLSCLINSVT